MGAQISITRDGERPAASKAGLSCEPRGRLQKVGNALVLTEIRDAGKMQDAIGGLSCRCVERAEVDAVRNHFKLALRRLRQHPDSKQPRLRLARSGGRRAPAPTQHSPVEVRIGKDNPTVPRQDRTATGRGALLGLSAKTAVGPQCGCPKAVTGMIVKRNNRAQAAALNERHKGETRPLRLWKCTMSGCSASSTDRSLVSMERTKKLSSGSNEDTGVRQIAQAVVVFDFESSCVTRRSHPSRKYAHRMTARLKLVRLTMRDDLSAPHDMGRKKIADDKNSAPYRRGASIYARHSM